MPQPQVRVGWRSGTAAQSVSSILETYSSALIAFSFRKMRTGYSGAAVRIRRGGDDSERDFGFVNGSVDAEAILNWIGYPNKIMDYSENMSLGGGWSGTGYTRTAITGTAGPGDISVINNIVETTVNNVHGTGYSIISGTTDTHNYSAFLKKGIGASAPDRMIVAIGNATYNAWGVFNLTTGQIDQTSSTPLATGLEILMTDAGNGWWRCSVGAKLGYSTNQAISIRVQFCNNSASYNPFTNIYVGSTASDAYVTGHMWTNTTDRKRYGMSAKSSGYDPGQGYVVKWYNQATNASTNGNHDFLATTATKQPKIVAAGTLCTIAGKPALLFDGTDDGAGPSDLIYPAGSTYPEPVSQFAVARLDPTYSTTAGHTFFSHGSNMTFRFSVSSDKYSIFSGGTAIASAVSATSSPMLVSAISSATDQLRINGNTIVSGNTGTSGPVGGYIYLGRAYSGTSLKGYIGEYIMSADDKGASASVIEDAMNSYWSLYSKPNIVSDSSLVLHVDASVPQSYPIKGTVWGDLSGSMQSSGGLIGTPGFTASFGGGIVLNGTSQFVNFGTNRCKSDDFTMEAVFKIDDLPTFGGICNLPRQPIIGQQDWGYTLQMEADGKVYFVIRDTGGPYYTLSTINSVLGSVSHIAVKKSGTAVSMYLNGTLQATATMSTGSIRWNSTSWPFTIGNNQCGGVNYVMKGVVYLARYYSSSLTEPQIIQNFNATKSRFGL